MSGNSVYGHIKRVIISEEEIKRAIAAAGEKITAEYAGKQLLIVGLLKGSFIFMSDLCRAVKTPCEMDFMAVKSYQGDKSTGNVEIIMDLRRDISGYHVIVVEDIIDTGITLKHVSGMLKSRNPLSLKIVTLLDKPGSRKTDLRPDMALFTVPDLFVIGYGLDYNEYYRELPYIAEYSA